MQFSFPSSADAFTPAEDLSHFVVEVSHSENEKVGDVKKTSTKSSSTYNTPNFAHAGDFTEL